MSQIKVTLVELGVTFFILLGEALASVRLFAPAEKIYRTGIKRWPHRRGHLLSLLGLLYEREMKFDKAVQAYQEACAADPDNGFIRIELGSIYEKQKKLQLAIAN